MHAAHPLTSVAEVAAGSRAKTGPTRLMSPSVPKTDPMRTRTTRTPAASARTDSASHCPQVSARKPVPPGESSSTKFSPVSHQKPTFEALTKIRGPSFHASEDLGTWRVPPGDSQTWVATSRPRPSSGLARSPLHDVDKIVEFVMDCQQMTGDPEVGATPDRGGPKSSTG